MIQPMQSVCLLFRSSKSLPSYHWELFQTFTPQFRPEVKRAWVPLLGCHPCNHLVLLPSRETFCLLQLNAHGKSRRRLCLSGTRGPQVDLSNKVSHSSPPPPSLYIMRERERERERPTKGKELDLAAPESNALLLMNWIRLSVCLSLSI